MATKKYDEKDEIRGWLTKSREENKQLEKINASLNGMRLTIFESLYQEREDLIARIHLIDNRVSAMGLGNLQKRPDGHYYRWNDNCNQWDMIF